MTSKIKSLHELVRILDDCRSQGQRIVFTNGCFDLLHVGHVRTLQAARDLGDVLVVGLNSDTSVRQLKGPHRPIVPEAQRAEVMAAIGCVQYVVIFDDPAPLDVITAIQPDVLVKGGDWPFEKIIGRQVVERRGGEVVSAPPVPDVSTTRLLARIKNGT